MWLKIIIVVLFVAILVTLGGAFVALMEDQGKSSKRTANLLAVRVGLAALLVILVTYGVWTGTLGISAPWHMP